MKPPKIVVIGPCYPYRGGIATFVAHLCNKLAPHFDVHLINYSLLYPSFLFPGKTQYDESENLIFSFPNERIVNSINPISWFRTAQRIRQLNPDLIIIDWWNPFFSFAVKGITAFLGKTFKQRIFLIAENVVSHEGRKADALLTRNALNAAHAYLALSDKVAAELMPYTGSKKIFKSHLPIYSDFDTEQQATDQEARSKLGYAPEDYVLLFFGYIRKYKGLDIALQAMPAIKKAIPSARLLIVGESYDDIAEYTSLIDQLGLAQEVQLISEYVPNEAVAQYFQASDCVLLPYRTATQSGILNIAYGFTKPVVATNVGGFAEFIRNGETGILVEGTEPDTFARGVAEWYRIRHTTAYADAIRAMVAQNSFDNIADIIRAAISNSRLPA